MQRLTAGVSLLALLLLAAAPGRATSNDREDPARLARERALLARIEASPRGPFKRIRWFCQDGAVLPPKAGACAEHGGGVQHGEWSDDALALRDAGYQVANVLVSLDPARYTGEDPALDELAQVLVERFLIGADDGFVFRGARGYRGALQAEDEARGARELVDALAADPVWRGVRFPMLREAARLLPLETDVASADSVRRQALELAERDTGFAPLRIKIHGLPDASDAEAVRRYAASGPPELAEDYARLAAEIDALYAPRRAGEELRRRAAGLRDAAATERMRDGAARLDAAGSPRERLEAAGPLLAELRDAVATATAPGVARAFLLASLAVEQEAWLASNALLAEGAPGSRRERLLALRPLADALYGCGLMTAHQRREVEAALARLQAAPPRLDRYREELRLLARAPEWGNRTLAFHFGEAVARLARIAPKAVVYPQDRLRGSPLLAWSADLDALLRDANALAGIEHEIFGQTAGAGLRALNPGIARGTLHVPAPGDALEHTDEGGIYLLPETVSDLPPVAGILTQGEGSSLSHVQLLARNLGIPNVVIGASHLAQVRAHDGERVVLAVSREGVVQLDPDGPRWDEVFGREGPTPQLVIRPDLDKLDLEARDFVPLAQLRAADSGRISGPKGANLGELRAAFGSAVPDGFVIPFGAFRAVLEQPLEPGGPSVFAWMRARYAQIAAAADEPARRARLVTAFLDRLRAWITTCQPGAAFEAQLDAALARLGAMHAGVFVRSDTNVEDLPGFTGAGLNETIPNVVGRDAVLAAIRRVWASPFTERAYGWRQAHMEAPEYVFPAVLVQRGFPADRSGVLVTRDLADGRPGWLSVAVSEGVGGAVDGQAAESLRIEAATGATRQLARATAPWRRELDPAGGIRRVRASGADALLDEAEVAKLIALAAQAPGRFPALRGDDGKARAADIEFAFHRGELAVLQIRPLVENEGAARSRHLAELDARVGPRRALPVDLDAPPGSARRAASGAR